MRFLKNLLPVAIIAASSVLSIRAQDLSPRAYVITPQHSNAVIVTYSFYSGGVQFDGALPITDSTAKINVPIFAYYHSLSFFGRSANVTAYVPYGVGHLQGALEGVPHELYRSGLLDSVYRFAVNLHGGPAMNVPGNVQMAPEIVDRGEH